MLVGQTLVELCLSSYQVDWQLTRQDQALCATLYIDHAGDVLLGIDDIFRRLLRGPASSWRPRECPFPGLGVAAEHELEIRCEDGRSDVKRLRRRILNLAAGASIVAAALAAGPPVTATVAAGTGGCQLNSAHQQIQHVIHIQFDNVHFTRDNPNVPSD